MAITQHKLISRTLAYTPNAEAEVQRLVHDYEIALRKSADRVAHTRSNDEIQKSDVEHAVSLVNHRPSVKRQRDAMLIVGSVLVSFGSTPIFGAISELTIGNSFAISALSLLVGFSAAFLGIVVTTVGIMMKP